MGAADQRRPDEIGLRRLNLGDGRAEIGDVEREEIDRGDFAAVLGHVFLHPLRGDLAVIVVGRDHIDLLAPFLHRVRHELLHRLGRRYAGVELIAVADAAFVLRVVEIKGLELVEHGTNDLARGGGDAAVHDRDLVLERRLLRELRIELHARLRVVADQLDRPADQPARRIRLFDRQRQRVDHRLAVDVEAAREVVQTADQDRIRRKSARAEDADAGRRRGCLQELSAIDAHAGTPVACPGRRSDRRGRRSDICSPSQRQALPAGAADPILPFPGGAAQPSPEAARSSAASREIRRARVVYRPAAPDRGARIILSTDHSTDWRRTPLV